MSKKNIDSHEIEEEVVVEEMKSDDELKKLQQENQALKELFLREKAENDNLRKRHTRELEDAAKYSVGSFAKDLTEVMDSLYIAQFHKKDFTENSDEKISGMFEGIDMTLKLFEKAFEKYGIARIYPENEIFNHEIHQAVSSVAVKNMPSNTIVQVIQAGYIIKDRLLKPALVIVSA